MNGVEYHIHKLMLSTKECSKARQVEIFKQFSAQAWNYTFADKIPDLILPK